MVDLNRLLNKTSKLYIVQQIFNQSQDAKILNKNFQGKKDFHTFLICIYL